eukprot:1617125-Rhodomonas_salina.2
MGVASRFFHWQAKILERAPWAWECTNAPLKNLGHKIVCRCTYECATVYAPTHAPLLFLSEISTRMRHFYSFRRSPPTNVSSTRSHGSSTSTTPALRLTEGCQTRTSSERKNRPEAANPAT